MQIQREKGTRCRFSLPRSCLHAFSGLQSLIKELLKDSMQLLSEFIGRQKIRLWVFKTQGNRREADADYGFCITALKITILFIGLI